MTPGKLAAQAGHAFLETYLQACRGGIHPGCRVHTYRRGGLGTKVTLETSDKHNLSRLIDQLPSTDLPYSVIVDSGHVIPGTEFDGHPIITAVGVGPINREEAKLLRLNKYNLVK